MSGDLLMYAVQIHFVSCYKQYCNLGKDSPQPAVFDLTPSPKPYQISTKITNYMYMNFILLCYNNDLSNIWFWFCTLVNLVISQYICNGSKSIINTFSSYNYTHVNRSWSHTIEVHAVHVFELQCMYFICLSVL